MSIAELIVRDFELEAAHSKNVLEAVPEDRFDWKPHEKSMTLGQLAGHIAEAPSWVESMGTDSFDMADAGGDGEYAPFVPASSQELLETQTANAAAFVRFLDGRDDDFMSANWTMMVGGETVVSMPRDGAIRAMLIQHICHHRGQLTVYLRMLGVSVPQTYGPTADFPK